jgi:hypothetical protein
VFDVKRKEITPMNQGTRKFLLFLPLLLAAIVLLPSTAPAQVPGPHPHYMRAIEDLRLARAYLSEGWGFEAVRGDDDKAVAEIDQAMREIRMAEIDDGKDIGNHPPLEVHLSWRDRFGRANDLLNRAQTNLDQAEEIPESRGMRNRALVHIHRAHFFVDHAYTTAAWQ